MNVAEFIAKWRRAELTERSASQQHFLDLCDLLDQPKPAEVDPRGDFFTFEKGATKRGGGDGWADVWKRGYFAWEYKGRHKDLDAAYEQLDRYRAALENPPLLVTCDMDRLVVRTNFTGTRQDVHDLRLDDLDTPRGLEILRAVFFAPHKLKPGAISEAITTEAARKIGELAVALRDRGLDPRDVAHFLDRVVFSFFAEDVELLPKDIVKRLLETSRRRPELFPRFARELFTAMSEGGFVGIEEIRRFNGNLFENGPVLELTRGEIERLHQAARLDWSAVDASIFGTLFERGIDPEKRSQLGAHYTSREDIETLVEPVVMKPLRREWREVQELVANVLETGKKRPRETDRAKPPLAGGPLRKARLEASTMLRQFHEKLAQLRVLDPACGSGNFLYVTLQKLKDLEKEVIVFGLENGLPGRIPLVSPRQLHGIEVNPYAFELAQMTVWIGYLQWLRQNGSVAHLDPVLEPLDTFECKDAILDLGDPENPREPEWPRVDFIVGNPPFLGNRLTRKHLGDSYVDALFEVYGERLRGRPDLCSYWFERARTEITRSRCRRAGLLATQAIRGSSNRRVLELIRQTTAIFFAESDRPWVLDGANVHVSMIGFGEESEPGAILDGSLVGWINSDLTSGTDATAARSLSANFSIAFQGVIKRGQFDLPDEAAHDMLLAGGNPNGRPNSDVLIPYLHGLDVTGRRRWQWVVDFGQRSAENAALYALPYGYVLEHVHPKRQGAKQPQARALWWQHWCPRPELEIAIRGLNRFLATPRVTKHRLFAWLHPPLSPDAQLIIFADHSDGLFGLLHSRSHEVWARRQGSQLRERESGFRYTPTTCFETFPFPEPTSAQRAAIAAAARELDNLRERWLNPPEWVREEVLTFPGAVDGPWARYVHDPDERGIGTVRYPRLVPRDDEAAGLLARRTLTNLYNQRPAWLDQAHRQLDEAVFAAYGWPSDLDDEEVLERLLRLNLERAAAGG